MTTFSDSGRDLSGWDALKALHASLYAKPELRDLEGVIDYAKDMPPTSRGMDAGIDLRAGTSVRWNIHEDALDHHWEIRRIERMATAWRALIPSKMDWEGLSDAECWIAITAAGITAHAMREDGQETDEGNSTASIVMRTGPDGWTTTVEVSYVWDGTASDLLALDGAGCREAVASRLWNPEGAATVAVRTEDGEVVFTMPPEVLCRIDAPMRADADAA